MAVPAHGTSDLTSPSDENKKKITTYHNSLVFYDLRSSDILRPVNISFYYYLPGLPSQANSVLFKPLLEKSTSSAYNFQFTLYRTIHCPAFNFGVLVLVLVFLHTITNLGLFFLYQFDMLSILLKRRGANCASLYKFTFTVICLISFVIR